MPTNPLYHTNDSPNNSTQPTKAVNRQGVNIARTHNNFDMSYNHYMTQKFGEYDVPFVMECVPGDRINLQSSHLARALSLKSPFMDSLTINKDWFLIPNEAIQPNTFDYIYKHPAQGDDVPEDAHNIFPYFYYQSSTAKSFFLNGLFHRLADLDYLDNDDDLTDSVWLMLILEKFLSSGSLLNKLGFKFNVKFRVDEVDNYPEPNYYSFDYVFDRFFRSFTNMYLTVATGDIILKINLLEDNEEWTKVDLYTLLSLLRRYGSACSLNCYVMDNDQVVKPFVKWSNVPTWTAEDTQFINMDRVISYQLVCSQYYVNPQVDFLYNAQLYRDNIYTLWRKMALLTSDSPVDTEAKFFTLNGIRVPYDYCSLAYYRTVLETFDMLSNQSGVAVSTVVYDYINALFGYRESLKFGDYFTDSRTRPLAIGDNNVAVTADGVDVVDMSRSIIMQRFRNAVIKLGNNIGDYLRGIMGEDMTPDYHIPKFIIHQEFNVDTNEVANTSATDQGKLVTNINSADDQFAFDIEIDMPCILLGVSYFSIPRAYSQTKERFFFHRNRYDMFNPMLQYLGDQIVYNNERTDMRPSDEIFGYQSRHNEYKQRYSVVSGGFVGELPAWTFVTDSLYEPVYDGVDFAYQSPDFIRAHDYEFNRFLSAVPGLSLGSGFHFIMRYNHKVSAVRPMEVNPNTL